MNNLPLRYIFILFFCIMGHQVHSQNSDKDTTIFSLITCDPGEPIYTLFGHTAIRYQNHANNIDYVFNYGIFSFDAPNFVWRFVKGETDYYLGVSSYDRFAQEYLYFNRAVREQVLNLTDEEKNHLLNLLKKNHLPENRMYRYNFLYDNCATRPRDIIKESIKGEVVYPEENYRLTFRNIIHENCIGYDWSRFGMDFCLGVDADKPITYKEEMFAPFYLMEAFAQAHIIDGNENRILVTETNLLVDPPGTGQSGSYLFTPMRTFLLLFIVITGFTIYGIKRKKTLWWLDILLFSAAGIAGSITALLLFASEHPAVSPNYLIFVFHPLHLLVMPFFIYKEKRKRRSIYHQANTVVLTLFILLWPVIPQYFNLAILPLALCLLVRSLSNLVLTYKPNMK